MVRMKHNRDAIMLSHRVDMMCQGNRSKDGCSLVGVVDSLASEKNCATIGYLNDDRGVHFLCALHNGIDRAAGDNIHGGDGEFVIFSILEKLCEVFTKNNTWFEKVQHAWHLRVEMKR